MDATFKVTVIQQRPYTCVTVETLDGTQCIGFSKICKPDAWSAQMGMQLALGRAMADLFGIKHKSGVGIAVYLQSDPRQLAALEPEPEAKGDDDEPRRLVGD